MMTADQQMHWHNITGNPIILQHRPDFTGIVSEMENLQQMKGIEVASRLAFSPRLCSSCGMKSAQFLFWYVLTCLHQISHTVVLSSKIHMYLSTNLHTNLCHLTYKTNNIIEPICQY